MPTRMPTTDDRAPLGEGGEQRVGALVLGIVHVGVATVGRVVIGHRIPSIVWTQVSSRL